MTIALFDLDRTLLDLNSGSAWVRREWRSGRLGWTQAAWAAWWLGRYALGHEALDRAFAQAAAAYANRPEAEVRDEVETWFDAEIRHRLRPGARDAIATHRAAGDRLVLATTSSQFAAEAAARAFGLDDVISTVVEVRDGVLTGRLEANAFGAGKARQVAAWAAREGVSLVHATFYTDSASDLPLLRAVGRPRVVHPDRRLARAAAAEGWPVLDWGRP